MSLVVEDARKSTPLAAFLIVAWMVGAVFALSVLAAWAVLVL